MRYLFFCAHPDDLEFYISNLMITVASNPKNVVKIISMTRGEYGTLEPTLRGSKLGQIRTQELRTAAKIEGVTDVDFLGYIDAHLEITPEAIKRVQNAIEAFNPDIIFAPEGIYSYYPHDDHIRTGLIIYYILKNMKQKKVPKLFMYHSYVNTHYFPMIHWRRQSKALRCHKSQYHLLLPTYPLRFLLGIYFGFRLRKRLRLTFLAEAFRKVDFQVDKKRQLGFRQRLIGRIISKVKGRFNPYKID
ncbi:MAG: PIG-L deacetylase family protein [Candidatus Helarchaeota archaeon]